MITDLDLAEEALKIAKENSHKKNPLIGGRCYHFDGDNPSCLFGHAMHSLGLTSEDISEDGLEECDVINDLYNLKDELQTIQTWLDNRGKSREWGEAIPLLKELIDSVAEVED